MDSFPDALTARAFRTGLKYFYRVSTHSIQSGTSSTRKRKPGTVVQSKCSNPQLI